MYRCSEVVRLISTDEYLSAGLLTRLRIRLHLALCRHCARYLRQLRAIEKALHDSVETVPDSEVEIVKSCILGKLSEKP